MSGRFCTDSAVILAQEHGGRKKQDFYVVRVYAKRSAFLQQTFRFYRQRDGSGIIPVIINSLISIFMSGKGFSLNF